MARILVCDDAAFMRTTIRQMLGEDGHEIVGEAETEQEALAKYEEYKPDLVTMDILMKTSGVDIIKKIRELDSKAKIVIVSVLSEQESEVIEAVRSGAQGIVTKPIRKDVFLAEIKRVLAKNPG